MTDQIDRATIERAKEELLDGLQFAQHRLKAFQLQAAMGGDEAPMVDEQAKIERIEAKLVGLGYGMVIAEQNERAALSAQRVAEQRAAVEEVRSLLQQHESALAELDEALEKLLPVGELIGTLAGDISRASSGLWPAVAMDPNRLLPMPPPTQEDSFLVAAGVYQGRDVTKTLGQLIAFARRVAQDRETALRKLAKALPEVDGEEPMSALGAACEEMA